ncbi:unnamed protein product, partial [Musa acuminata var. zebrina]
ANLLSKTILTLALEDLTVSSYDRYFGGYDIKFSTDVCLLEHRTLRGCCRSMEEGFGRACEGCW